MSSYRIDEVTPSMYEQLGEELLQRLSTIFYGKVYDQDVRNKGSEYYETFGRFFEGSTQEEAIRNQYEFFTQRLGGPPLYSMRKGHPALRARHRNFVITTVAADRWIHHMKATLEELPLNEDQRDILMEFFANVAYFLRNVQE